MKFMDMKGNFNRVNSSTWVYIIRRFKIVKTIR